MIKKLFKALMRYASARPNSDNARQFISSGTPETPLQLGRPEDRASIRQQARYQFQNNPHAAGIARLFALYTCGTGARLRWLGHEKWLRQPVDKRLVDYIEYKWAEFSTEIRFGSLLRSVMQSLVVDGEAFVAVRSNPHKRAKIDAVLLDSQRVGNPSGKRSTLTLQDGVQFDVFGNVTGYYVYKTPDNDSCYYDTSRYDFLGADQVFHLYREDFASQTRGFSWFAPVLPLLQQLLAYTNATVEAAKAGARIFATIETQNGYAVDDYLDIESGVPYDAYRSFETPNGRILQLPVGTTIRGFNPTQPTTTADAYTANLLSQIGYAMGLPRNKATGSSHEYNFASGRLDNQPFELLITTLQKDILERDFCDRLFALFYEMIYPHLLELDETAPTLEDSDWAWDWPHPPLVDPEATARTNAILIKSGQKSMREVWEEMHPEGDFDSALTEIQQLRALFPEIHGATIDPAETAIEPAETAINEPKAPSVENPE